MSTLHPFVQMLLAAVFVISCGADADGDTSMPTQRGGADGAARNPVVPAPMAPEASSAEPDDNSPASGVEMPPVEAVECEGPPISCLDCTTGQGSASPCVDGVWQCSAPLLPEVQCPGHNCEGRAPRCCNRANGHWNEVECLDAEFATCPEGLQEVELGEECIPDGYDVTHCRELLGKHCSAPATECVSQSACGRVTCTCAADEADGGYTWMCSSNAC